MPIANPTPRAMAKRRIVGPPSTTRAKRTAIAVNEVFMALLRSAGKVIEKGEVMGISGNRDTTVPAER